MRRRSLKLSAFQGPSTPISRSPENQEFRFNDTGVGGLSLTESGNNTLVRGNTAAAPGFEFVIDPQEMQAASS
jgi:hypothetical protein